MTTKTKKQPTFAVNTVYATTIVRPGVMQKNHKKIWSAAEFTAPEKDPFDVVGQYVRFWLQWYEDSKVKEVWEFFNANVMLRSNVTSYKGNNYIVTYEYTQRIF